MPPLRLLRAFTALWITTGALLLLWSVETVRSALDTASPPDLHHALLGAVEAVSAALFLVPPSLRVGAAGLVGTFAVGFGLHAAGGQFRGDLLLYGAAVTFIAIHGPLTRRQWRAALRLPAA